MTRAGGIAAAAARNERRPREGGSMSRFSPLVSRNSSR
jgi:hypothetical protein